MAVSEVGVRPPGAQITSMLSYAHDMDLYSAWARLMVSAAFDPPERRWSVGTVYLRGQGTGVVRGVHGLENLRDVEPLVVEAQLPRPGQQSSGSYEGDGFVIVRDRDTAVVAEALRRIVTGVRIELG